jgi:hypothetical protein
MDSRISYDNRCNTLLLSFRGFKVETKDKVIVNRESVADAILAVEAPGNKVHVVVDYNDAFIA